MLYNKAVFSALILLVFSSVSMAEIFPDKTKYVGVSIGSANSDSPGTRAYDFDNTASTFELSGGVKLRDRFFIELSLNSLGNYETTNSSYKESFTVISVNAIQTLPLVSNTLDVYGKLGYGLISWKRDLDFGIATLSTSDTGDTIVAGIGAQYVPGWLPKSAFRLGYDYFYYQTSNLLTDDDNKSNSIGVVKLSFIYDFLQH